jgi:hypothetical protein
MSLKAHLKHIRIARLLVLSCTIVLVLTFIARSENNGAQPEQNPSPVYLGFDANDYPGDAALPGLRKIFAFSGYWLNVPPGAKANPWMGKRDALIKNNLGFLVLFNGRLSKELKPPAEPSSLGVQDAELAVAAAQRDRFPANGSIVIYLDIEEGGRMVPTQISYIQSWSAGVTSKGFVAGVYCSGIKVKEGKNQTITTADDIHQRLPTITAYFVYNDECPPSPGCVTWKNPPPPSQSGFFAAGVWQFAQSPRRRNLTRHCSATYNPDGNCYPPGGAGTDHILLDLDVSVSPDPSTLVVRPIH